MICPKCKSITEIKENDGFEMQSKKDIYGNEIKSWFCPNCDKWIKI